jgi:hypothetical protein
MSVTNSELLAKMLREMQACGLTKLRSDQDRRPARAEGKPQTGERQGRQVANDEVIYLGDRSWKLAKDEVIYLGDRT